jgi:hypothetical protein
MTFRTDPGFRQFNREIDDIGERMAKFPHHFVNNVCTVCGKHEILEWIGGGCLEAFISHKLLCKVIAKAGRVAVAT